MYNNLTVIGFISRYTKSLDAILAIAIISIVPLIIVFPPSASSQRSLLLSSQPVNNDVMISNSTNINSSVITPINSTAIKVDKFGIKEIYPTKVGGREWYMNTANPQNDSIFSITSPSDQNITKQLDGNNNTIWRVSSPKVRMHATTPPGSALWKNVEITGYVRVDSIISNKDSNNTDIAWLARSGRHNDEVPCDGTALIGGIHDDGTVGWKKEIWFTGGYTKELAQSKPIQSIVGRWIGWKVIMYNINNNTAVKMQSYLDDKNSNHWIKVTDILDDGGWFADATDNEFYSANCGRAKDHIITNGGPNVTFRSDNLVMDFKNLSVREIQASNSLS